MGNQCFDVTFYMYDIFLISTKAPESVIQYCNLTAIIISEENLALFSNKLKHKVPLSDLSSFNVKNEREFVEPPKNVSSVARKISGAF